MYLISCYLELFQNMVSQHPLRKNKLKAKLTELLFTNSSPKILNKIPLRKVLKGIKDAYRSQVMTN